MQLISASTYFQNNPSKGTTTPAPLPTGHNTPLTIYKLNSAHIWGKTVPLISPIEDNTNISYALSESSCFYADKYLEENLEYCTAQAPTA